MTMLPVDFRFSQSSLQDYLDCRYRFKMRYLLRQPWPAAEAEPLGAFEQHLRQGERFHRLVHQHLVGIPAAALAPLAAEDPLRQWWAAYLQTGLNGLPAVRYPEIVLAAQIAGHWVTAKYDLIAVTPGARAIIVDWKTGKRPPRARLAKSMQTVVYRCLLAAAGAHLNGGAPLAPEQIEMVYWFAQEPDNPERLVYDRSQFELDGTTLAALVSAIAAAGPDDFPRTEDQRHCQLCVYRSLCNRGTRAGSYLETDMAADAGSAADWDLGTDFDQIAEIEF